MKIVRCLIAGHPVKLTALWGETEPMTADYIRAADELYDMLCLDVPSAAYYRLVAKITGKEYKEAT